jgi:hypothetical protein
MKTASNYYTLSPFVSRGEISLPGQNGNYGDNLIKLENDTSFFSVSNKTAFSFTKNLQHSFI